LELAASLVPWAVGHLELLEEHAKLFLLIFGLLVVEHF
jgi:hypothetical protein